MQKRTLFRIASGLNFFVFLGHTSGLFRALPPDQVQVIQVYESMKQTMVRLPMGSPKSIATMMLGANIGVSVLLFVLGYFYLSFSREETTKKCQLAVVNIAAIALGVVSYFCFFPLPALCTGLAGLLGFLALTKRELRLS